MEVLTLEKICEAKSSNIAQKDLENNNGCYPIYGASGFIKNVDFYKFERPYLAIVKDGAGVGRVMSLPGKSSIIGTMQAILPNDNIDIDYLFYYLKSKNLGKYYTGATIPHIYFKDYKKEKCNVYSLEEQRIVSKKLKLIDSMIDYKNKQIEQLNQLIKSQFVEMFGTVKNNKYNYEIKSLSDVFELIKDGTHSTPTYTDDKENGVKFLSAKDVTTGKINWSDIKYIPTELHEVLSKRIKPQKGDILLCKNGTTGICAKVDVDELFDIYVSLALLRPNLGYNIDYLVEAINSFDTKKQFDSSLKGIGVPNLHLGEIAKAKILVPPLELQNRFAQIVEQIDKQKFEFENSLKKLEELQASLMQEYFG